ncbi:hypothetical protein [Streptomyces sp. NPDC058486]|uniref:hypothetical protein n=1 Tax=unclassified Streptomyces TaxID=2593676 RepID=UPI0036598ED2
MLIEVLLLHRTLPADAVVAGMTTVLRIGAVNTDLVAIEARKAMEKCGAEPNDDGTDDVLGKSDGVSGTRDGGAEHGAKVISLHTKRMPTDLRVGLPDMSKYDRLLKPAVTTATSAAATPKKGTSA